MTVEVAELDRLFTALVSWLQFYRVGAIDAATYLDQCKVVNDRVREIATALGWRNN